MSKTFTISVNGRNRTARCEADTPFLYVLRNDFALNGPKFGCGLGQCGACTVLLDGTAVRTCVLPISAVPKSAKVVTIEGLARNGKLDRLQAAFLEEQAAQCGYCTSGMIMKCKELLAAQPNPSDAIVREAIDSHICRCGVQNRIVKAVLRAAKEA